MKVFALIIALTLFSQAILAQQGKEPANDLTRNRIPHDLYTVPWIPRPWLPIPWPKPWPEAAGTGNFITPIPEGSPDMETIDGEYPRTR
ncbi:hypothetical protein V5799_003122 [Amblyomma americanum]|uniref:Secreted protein n=1 Tax=Amblyomma americanum TaxID=6943 RepID=A0AAQ4D9V5_AMBAM